jgi:hypothetical protein
MGAFFCADVLVATVFFLAYQRFSSASMGGMC